MKMLIVDDNPEDRKMLRYTLEHGGHQVVEATNGSEGLEKAKSSHPDFIISDALMPVKDGFQFLYDLKQDENLKAIPFVYYSSEYNAPPDKRLGASLGAAAFIKKPKEPDAFITELNAIIAAQAMMFPESQMEEREFLQKYNLSVVRKLEEKVRELEREIRVRQLTERALRESEERFRSFAETAIDAIIMTQPPGFICFWNRAAEKMFGYSFDEVHDTHLADLIVPLESRERVRAEIAESYRYAGEQRQEIRGEYSAKRKDGSEFPIEISMALMPLKGQWRSAVIIKDITRRKMAEAQVLKANADLEESLARLKSAQTQLIRSEKMASLGVLSAGVAHEIKNPLNIINMSVQLLEMDGNLSNDIKKQCGTIREQVQRAVKITENLRDFARQRASAIEEVNIHQLLEKTLQLIEYEAALDNLKVVRCFNAEHAQVKGDRDQLAQVFLNMINNARDSIIEIQAKHTYPALLKSGWKGELLVETGLANGHLFIRFADTGIGIHPDAVNKIFDPFFTTKPEGKGTGLGLSISAGIVESHGGRIDCESREGNGAVFTIFLPAGGMTAADS